MSERMIKQFMEMVKIDSESGKEERYINYLVDQFKELGADVTKDSYGNLIAKLPAKGCEGKDAILLSCHADTVKPGVGIEPVLKDGVIRSKGKTILAADDKAGIAEMLEALRIAEIHPPIEVAISRQEEVGLLGVKNLDFKLLTAKKGFLLDNDTLETIVNKNTKRIKLLEITADEKENFYRLVGSYQGLSLSLISYATAAEQINWNHWEEEVFA